MEITNESIRDFISNCLNFRKIVINIDMDITMTAFESIIERAIQTPDIYYKFASKMNCLKNILGSIKTLPNNVIVNILDKYVLPCDCVVYSIK